MSAPPKTAWWWVLIVTRQLGLMAIGYIIVTWLKSIS